jgi:hypothetical protein
MRTVVRPDPIGTNVDNGYSRTNERLVIRKDTRVESRRGPRWPGKAQAKDQTAREPKKGEFLTNGSLIRTKTLLLAALRVWELKQPGENSSA